MIKFSLLFLAVLALTQAKSLDAEASVKVQLYYESLCPDCAKFITQQLHQTYQSLGSSLIKLEMIPVANETILPNGNKQHLCRRGEKECLGNKAHGCALALHKIEVAEAYIHCLTKTGGSADPKFLKQCATDVKIPFEDIEKCMSSGKGDEIFSANVKKARAASSFLKSVPTVVFDGKFNEKDNVDAASKLKIVVCVRLGHVDKCKHNATMPAI